MALCSDNFRKEFTFEDEGEKRWRLYFKRPYMPLTPGDLMEMAAAGVSEEVAKLLFSPMVIAEMTS
jgi:hypothetical protein